MIVRLASFPGRLQYAAPFPAGRRGSWSLAVPPGERHSPAGSLHRKLPHNFRISYTFPIHSEQKQSAEESYIPMNGLALIITGVFVAFFPSTGHPEESPTGQRAPVSRGFQNYLDYLADTGTSLKTVTDATGFIPSPQDYSHLKGVTSSAARQILKATATLPTSHDLRTLGRVTPVKDQGDCGACWAFASTTSLESNLLTSETWDFSENNLKNVSGFDYGHCDGGNYSMASAYFARWGGAVAESDDPYSATSNVSPSGLSVRKHVRDVLVVAPRAGSTDNDAIKQAVIDYGAVSTSMYYSSDYFNSTTNAYYYDGASDINHGVAIVGWDDSYGAANFSPAPAGDGAFIVKNSWGTSWGEGGYFYVSYYDAKFGDGNYVFVAEDPLKATTIYQYDPLGQIGTHGYGTTSGWFANIFSAENNEDLTSVAFYTLDVDVAYDVYVYRGVTAGAPRSGTEATHLTGTIPCAGYHTIELTSPVSLTTGELFSVVVKVTNTSYQYPIPTEYAIAGYSSQASAASGQSFISASGSSWTDAASPTLRKGPPGGPPGSSASSNVCLKAFAADATAPVVSSFSLPEVSTGKLVTLTSFTATDAVGVTGYYLSESGKTPLADGSGWLATPPESYSFADGGTKTLYGFAKDAAGNVSQAATAQVSINLAQQLTVTLVGSGAGSVVSDPEGLSCGTGACSAQFSKNSVISLRSEPDSDSTFSGWGGDCDGTSSCLVTMNGAKNVTARFTLAPPAKIVDQPYDSLELALKAATDDASIRARSISFTESLNISRTITLRGGFDAGFTSNANRYSTLNGVMTVGSGALTVENFVIK